jgi:putative transposase
LTPPLSSRACYRLTASYFNVRLGMKSEARVLVLIGATEDGSKELLAVVDGYRESTRSWRELLGQVKRLGLSTAPKLAIGDGSLGFLAPTRKAARAAYVEFTEYNPIG